MERLDPRVVRPDLPARPCGGRDGGRHRWPFLRGRAARALAVRLPAGSPGDGDAGHDAAPRWLGVAVLLQRLLPRVASVVAATTPTTKATAVIAHFSVSAVVHGRATMGLQRAGAASVRGRDLHGWGVGRMRRAGGRVWWEE